MSPVTEVEAMSPAVAGGGIVAHGMDRPGPTATYDEYALPVAGWVYAHPAPAVAVEISAGGRVVKSAPVSIVRPDVAERHRELAGAPSGYVTTVGLLGLPGRARLQVVAVLADERRVPLGEVLVRHAPPPCAAPVRYRPMMVTSLGRMGTTWFMRLLAEHPSIVAHRAYPYEVMAGRYWAHQLGVLAAPADYLTSCTPDNFAGDLGHVGHNPFYGQMLQDAPELARWLGHAHVDAMAAYCRASIDGFYTEVARLQGQEPSGYFAEKFLPDHLTALMWDLYPDARELVLVRDIRDVVCSMLAFNAKRGNQSFGRELAGDDVEFVRNLARDMGQLLEQWTARGQQAQLVRYEDLVRNPSSVLSSVLRYAELGADEETIDAMIGRASEDLADLDSHRTSAAPQASIGRWRRDLAPELAAVCHEEMGATLEAFGYDAAAA